MRPFPTLAALWTLGVLVVCLIPGEDIPVVAFALTDKLVHVAMFAGFGVLWLRAAPARRLGVFGWGVGFAVLIEVLQGGIPSIHRSGDPLDVVADVVGLALAFAVDAGLRRRAQPPAVLESASEPRARPSA